MRWEDYAKIAHLEHFIDAKIGNVLESRRQTVAEWVRNPRPAVFFGNAGRGKTYALCAILRALIENHPKNICEIRYIKSRHIDERILHEMKNYGSAKGFIDSISEPCFLLIDDFGTERDTDRSIGDMTDILDERQCKITLITTNLTTKEVENTYGPRMMSRLKPFDWIKFGGEDLRKKQKKTTKSV